MIGVKLLLLHSNTWNYLTVCEKKWDQVYPKMSSRKCVYKLYIYWIYMYIQDLALNNQQWLIYH